MAQDTVELINIQRSIVGQLKKVWTNYRKAPKDRLTQGYIQRKVDEIERLWSEYSANDRKLETSASEEDKANRDYFIQDEYSASEEVYAEYHSNLLESLTAMPKPKALNVASIPSTSRKPRTISNSQRSVKGNPTVDHAAVCPRSTPDPSDSEEDGPSVPSDRPTIPPSSTHFRSSPIKLPRINLSTFNGDYREWMSFRDLFSSLVHSNQIIPPVQKLHYLKSCLSGDALQLVRHLTTVDANYEIAWSLIQQRYQNDRSLITAEIATLLSQPVIQSENPYQIRKMLDTSNECLASLRGLQVEVEHWDPIIVYVITQRLPHETRALWEQSLGHSRTYPKLEGLFSFLDGRFRALEAVAAGKTQVMLPKPKNINPQLEKPARVFHITHDFKCPCCSEPHTLRHCRRFKQLTPQERAKFASQKKLCYNCLAVSHTVRDCPNTQSCFKCHRRHNTLLHLERELKPTGASSPYAATPATSNATSNVHSFLLYKPKRTLLATAMIKVQSQDGVWIVLRALLDPGSPATFITNAAIQLLKLRKTPVDVNIVGLGEIQAGRATALVKLKISADPDLSEFVQTEAMVVHSLTKLMPAERINLDHWPHLQHLHLADPQFHHPGHIDVIIGVDAYAQIVEGEVIRGPVGTPIAQKTLFGYVLFGELHQPQPRQSRRVENVVSLHACCNINDTLKRFWEIEEVPEQKELSADDLLCENIFATSHQRDPDGRYIVHLPFRPLLPDEPKFGASRPTALKRLEHLEHKLSKDPKMSEIYSACMEEYLSLGHMRKLTEKKLDIPPNNHCYLPHHGVVNEESVTTKLRVVFDASCRTTNGFSLNERLLTDPALQINIFSLLLEWRRKRFVFNGDIEKIYRQIQVFPEDANYQRVLWHRGPGQAVEDYCLLTVTFGTSSAPFTAIRTIHQLAQDESRNYPQAEKVLLTDVYVDDIYSGADEIEEAVRLQKELTKILQKGKFELRKWTANDPRLLEHIPDQCRLLEPSLVSVPNPFMVKTLGIYWNPSSDSYQFRLRAEQIPPPYTKRKVLSAIAKLYDPLGWLAPLVIIAKILLQRLWQSGVSWDEPLPQELSSVWKDYSEGLPMIEKVAIPRWLRISSTSSIQLHGFCDASERALAAVVFARIDNCGDVRTFLLCSKTKVAPLKPVTLPRLELCGAVLLSKLLRTVKDSFPNQVEQTVAWTDSSIVLAWRKKPPTMFKTFVRNRVAEILRYADLVTWRHVPSETNPADQASRGTSASKFIADTLWFHGPPWLREDPSGWPTQRRTDASQHKDPELKEAKAKVYHLKIDPDFSSLMLKFSSMTRLIRVSAYVFRFIAKCKRQPNPSSFLSSAEITKSRHFWITLVQRLHFPVETTLLLQFKPVPTKSKIISLQPFLDPDGILRVGGRLTQAALPYNQRHPIILPPTNHFVELLVKYIHISTLRGGPSLMLATLRQQFWVIRARQLIRRCVHQCVQCFRQVARTQGQLMADLPPERITISKPFTYVGIDYTGHMNIRTWRGRNARTYKGYICVFVCFSTKAIHLEVVSDCTTAAFLAAFRRFVARRGLCRKVFSDCGTNFVGAKRELDQGQRASLVTACRNMAEIYSNEGVVWKFIPPASPHFGGLWEAGVKSLKHHVKRILGNVVLTYEELATVTTQIEACLNSRPLCPLLDSPDDLSYLTPGHFLVGGQLPLPPERDLTDTSVNALQRWKLLQKLQQDFWQRWSSEYLSRLQQRPKWNTPSKNVGIGNIVLIKDERLPPLRWMLGRVVQTHPGKDGRVRVVTLRTQTGELQRPITKICLLPCLEPTKELPAFPTHNLN